MAEIFFILVGCFWVGCAIREALQNRRADRQEYEQSGWKFKE